MPRKPRLWYPGAVYHIMNRGNRRSDLFRDEKDYETYLRLLAIARGRYGILIFGYCLMTNHVHLQIETGDVPVWLPMKYVHMTYTQYFNEKYKLVGHLFQGRYTSIVIEDDAQMLTTSRYIHLNPVKAKMTGLPETYQWSSCGVFYGLRVEPLVERERILRLFPPDRERNYRLFLMNDPDSDP